MERHERLRVGEQSSGMIQRLFKQHYAKMLRVARTILYDEQESKDVVSDIFEELLRGRMVLIPDTEERYLLTSVRNQCLKRIRHQETRLRMETASAEQPSDAEDKDERMTDIVEFVVSHLTEQEQRIFRLRFTEGYSYEEIASTEDISRVAVWKHLSHALKEIRNRLIRKAYENKRPQQTALPRYAGRARQVFRPGDRGHDGRS